MSGFFLGVGALLGFAGVALGAFGAHGLKDKLTVEMLEVWETGVRYQVWHALALLAIGILGGHSGSGSRWLSAAGWLFLVGTVLFSGSIYLLATMGWRWLGPVTPLGGTALLAGWLCLAIWAFFGRT